MAWAAENFIARRYLKPRKGEGFLSVISGFSLIGIMLGVATLIVVMSVMNGFRSELLGQILGLNGHITLYSQNGNIKEYQDIVEKLEAMPAIKAVVPQIEGQALISVHNHASGVVVRSLAAGDLLKKPQLAQYLQQQTAAVFTGRDAIIIGKQMALRLNLQAGDTLTLVAPSATTTAFGMVPRYKVFSIIDVFETGMFEYDNNFIFMPLEAAQAFFRVPENTVEALDVTLIEGADMTAVIKDIRAIIADNYLFVRDWRESNKSFFNALQVERNVMFLILTLIILVAAFNIISSLIMLVKDKSRDIAILRTMGASAGQIMRIFVFCGALIGVIGTFLGLALGVVVAENIESIRQFVQTTTGATLFPGDVYFLSRLPAEIDWQEVFSVVLMALGLSFLATLYPAWKASRLPPVAVLRYE